MQSMNLSRMVPVSLLSLLLLAAWPVSADVWQRGSDGALILHRTLDEFQRARLAADWHPPTTAILRARRAAYSETIGQVATRYGVDEQLVHAIIEVESAYDAQAVSKTGAQGLMQLMPKTVERYAVLDPLDPTQNIEAGVRYLQELMREFQSAALMLAAYNAGEAAVRRYGNKVPPYTETRAYIERVSAVIDRERPEAPQ